jgi:mercuric ion transport protein
MLPLHPAKGRFPNVMARLIGRRVDLSEPKIGRSALALGGLAAILASTCCLGPLLLVALGFSGAWIGNLTALEPYRPLFIGAALVAMAFAYRQIFRPARACEPGEVCAAPQVRTTYKLIFGAVAALILVALAFPYILPMFY